MSGYNSARRPTTTPATRTTVSPHDETLTSTDERSTSSTLTTHTETPAAEDTDTAAAVDDTDTLKPTDDLTGTSKRTPSHDAWNRRLPGSSALLDTLNSQQLCHYKLMNTVVKYIAVPAINRHLSKELGRFGEEFADAHRVYFEVVNGTIYVEGDTAQQRFAVGLTQAWGRTITSDHANSLLKVIANYYDRAVTWWLDTHAQKIADLDEAIGAFFGSEELEARLRSRMTNMPD
ncbi:MAG: hypothetical protein ACKO3T_05325 [Planctomycetaceae bacterium]